MNLEDEKETRHIEPLQEPVPQKVDIPDFMPDDLPTIIEQPETIEMPELVPVRR